MRSTFALIFLMASCTYAFAQSALRPHVEIVEYGIYTTDKSDCARDDQGIERCVRSNVRHAATTSSIPAQLGVEFGLKYRVSGLPAGTKISIERNWLIPNPGLQPPDNSLSINRIAKTDTVASGEDVFISYGFDDPWELVPGPWVLELWYGGHRLASQSFTVTRQ